MTQSKVRVQVCDIRVVWLGALAFLLVPLAAFPPLGVAQEVFLRGDVNVDGSVSLSDAIYIRRYMFEGSIWGPVCQDAADANDDGVIAPSDEIYLLVALFRHGAAPPAPFPQRRADPTADALNCERQEIVAGPVTDDVIRAGTWGLFARPGAEIQIPVHITNSVAIEGVQLVFETDLSLLAIEEGQGALDFTGTVIEEFIGAPDWSSVTVLDPGRSFAIGICFGVDYRTHVIPPSAEERLLLKIRARVAAGARAGTEITVQPSNGPDGKGLGPYGLKNELCYRGGGARKDGAPMYQSALPQLLLASPVVVSEEFLRGDLDQDGSLSITDAVCIRWLLFEGTPTPCEKAADVDDNGRIELSDEIHLLGALFSNGSPPPPPFPEPGFDTTPDDLDCDMYRAGLPAQAAGDVLRVGDIVATPGQEILVPVYIKNSMDIHGVQLVLDTDLSIFAPARGKTAFDFTGTAIERFIGEPDWAAITVVEPGRTFVIGVCFGVDWTAEVLPASAEERLLLKIRGRVSEDMPGDAVLQIQPTNGPDGHGTGRYRYMNELCSHYGKKSGGDYYSILPQNLVGGALKVKGRFLRGDANASKAVDIADAIFTLSYLFAKGRVPSCLDAADANDSGGAIDIGDAITTLSHLFARTGPLPAPFPGCGVDLTDADDVGCAEFLPCVDQQQEGAR